jgi:hypothetical protein
MRQRVAGGLGVGHRHVDRHVGDRLAPRRVAFGQPVRHGFGRAAVDLYQQTARTGDVDQSGVEPIDPDSFPGVRACFVFRFAPAGFIDAEHGHRFGLGAQHRVGGRRDRVVTGVPRTSVSSSDRGHRPIVVEHCAGHLRLGPRRHPSPSRDRGSRLGERLALAHHVGTQPLTLLPHDLWAIRADLDIARPSRDPALRPRRSGSALRTFADPFVGSADNDHAGTVLTLAHRVDNDSFETEQQCTTVGQARAFLRSGCVRTPSSQGREPSISHRHDPNRSHQTPINSEEPVLCEHLKTKGGPPPWTPLTDGGRSDLPHHGLSWPGRECFLQELLFRDATKKSLSTVNREKTGRSRVLT